MLASGRHPANTRLEGVIRHGLVQMYRGSTVACMCMQLPCERVLSRSTRVVPGDR